MKQVVYKTNYTEFSKDIENSVAYMKWFPETEFMSEEEFKDEVIRRLKTCKELNLNKFLADDRDFAYPLVPEMQGWVVSQFSEVTVYKHAMVLPSELFSKVSVEKTLDEVEGSNKTYKKAFFEDLKEAEDWVMK